MKIQPENMRGILEELEENQFPSLMASIFGISKASFNQNIKTIINHGWYPPAKLEVKKINKIAELIKSGKSEEADKLLFEIYNENIKIFESELISKHSARKMIFKEAFKAHKDKKFFSSTILFLSQGDGIIDGKIFHNRKNFDKDLDKKRNPEIVSLLAEVAPLNIPSAKVKGSQYFSKLNRHAVMHGLDTNYGTEMNSLKALSLCCFANDWYNRY
jgi:hypothetical protein